MFDLRLHSQGWRNAPEYLNCLCMIFMTLQMMRLFFDFAIAQALKNNTLRPYTTEMSEAAHQLIEGMELEDE